MCSCPWNNINTIKNYLPEINTQKRNEDVNQKLTDQHLDQDDYILNGKSFNYGTTEKILYSKVCTNSQVERE